MKRKIEITFNWWNSSNEEKEIPKEIANELEKHAEERISEMRNEGYTSGELNFYCTNDEQYNGWWTFSYIDADGVTFTREQYTHLTNELDEINKKLEGMKEIK